MTDKNVRYFALIAYLQIKSVAQIVSITKIFYFYFIKKSHFIQFLKSQILHSL